LLEERAERDTFKPPQGYAGGKAGVSLVSMKGARFSLNGGRRTDALVVRPLSTARLRGLPPPPDPHGGCLTPRTSDTAAFQTTSRLRLLCKRNRQVSGRGTPFHKTPRVKYLNTRRVRHPPNPTRLPSPRVRDLLLYIRETLLYIREILPYVRETLLRVQETLPRM
jgi:hypothetical protein